MVVVDTNVLAYLLIEGDRTPDAQALYSQDADWRSEAFVMIELSNILATYRHRGVLGHSAAATLATAERLMSRLINLPHRNALALAMEFGVSAYDARFLGAAQQLGCKLVTEDVKLRAAAPALTKSLGQALAG